MDLKYKDRAWEEEYLSKTISRIGSLLDKEREKNKDNKSNIISSQKEMWENTDLYSNNFFDGLLSISQSFEPIGVQISSYESTADKINKLERMMISPYFARIDFKEDGEETEPIYIGRMQIVAEKNYKMVVYDWRAPICSMFYRFERGKAFYQAPMGKIEGEITLKRQFEIKRGSLAYYFDADINITDEILRKMLSENTSSKMKAIVETIQQDQDMIIRDVDNDLLIVQGVAGSGKTSVALHRVAYLMYQGLTSKLKAGDIAIISPNQLFSQYISDVLPELGETSVDSIVFEEILTQILTPEINEVQTRNQLFEHLITCEDVERKHLMKSSLEFKASTVCITILERFITMFASQMIVLEDIYYDDVCIFNKQFLYEFIVRGDTKTPLSTRLKTLERLIFNKVRELRKNRIEKLEEQVYIKGGHELEISAYARMLSIQESSELLKQIHQFTEIHYLKSYQVLMEDKNLFYQLAEGLNLPDNINEILKFTVENLSSDILLYEDALPLSYLKLKLAGSQEFYDIKQVLVDEAQDYYPIHFEILSILFHKAKYTILGDVNQTIEKQTDITAYDNIKRILNKKSSLIVHMNKSFRCTNEILNFSAKFLGDTVKSESFNRSGDLPSVSIRTNESELLENLLSEVNKSKELGYESICILCKSSKEANILYGKIRDRITMKLIDENNMDAITGISIIPIYLAKGLEFDSVLIYGIRSDTTDDTEQKLMYIAASRALHRLSVFELKGEGNN